MSHLPFAVLRDELSNDLSQAKTPEHLREKVRNIIYMFLRKLEVPEQELEEFTGKIKQRRFSEMFGLIDGYSVTKTREETRKEVAADLLLEHMDINTIARVAKLPLDKVTEIKERLQQEGRL